MIPSPFPCSLCFQRQTSSLLVWEHLKSRPRRWVWGTQGHPVTPSVRGEPTLCAETAGWLQKDFMCKWWEYRIWPTCASTAIHSELCGLGPSWERSFKPIIKLIHPLQKTVCPVNICLGHVLAEKSTISLSEFCLLQWQQMGFLSLQETWHGGARSYLEQKKRDGDWKKTCLMKLFPDHFIALCHPLSSIWSNSSYCLKLFSFIF